jgi:alkylation response protein AidB-like acyl-CoA dehydrogenase
MAMRDSVELSEDQHAQHDALRAILTDQLSSVELRSALNGETGYRPELHARLAGDLGLSGWTIPEEFGGLGKSQVEACAVHIELGRALYPGPFLSSSVAAGTLLATGHREACQRWLPQLATGAVAGTVASADEAGHWAPGPDSVRADYGTGGWRLSGRRWYVVAAHAAGIVMVPAVIESGLAMFLAETGSTGLEMSRQLDLDLTRRISIISFEAAPATLLTRDAAPALARAEREFLIATAAEAAGGIGWCLDASLAFVKDQSEFERPVGSFEAVASFCVDMLADLENASAAARYAAAATDVSAADAQKAARLAALQAGESYRRAAEAAIGLFGDIGFTQEHDAQLYYRRAWSAERLAGGPQAHRDALAARLSKTGGSGPRLPRPDIPVTHTAGQLHAKNDRRARLGARADVDIGVAHHQGIRVHDDARPDRQNQGSAPHVHLDEQRVMRDDRIGEVERHVAPRRPQLQTPRDHPAPGLLERTSPLVDPGHVLGLPRRRYRARRAQVGGQLSQFTERPGRQGGFHPLIELVSGQPPVTRGVAQHVYDSIPVGIRGSHLRRVREHILPLSLRGPSASGEPTLYRVLVPAKIESWPPLLSAARGAVTVQGPVRWLRSRCTTRWSAPRAHSSVVEHSPYKRGVTGSNPVAPTRFPS